MLIKSLYIMTFLILFISLNFMNFTEVPKQLPNTTIFKTSTEIAVSIYDNPIIDEPIVISIKPVIGNVPCFGSGYEMDRFRYTDCDTCTAVVGWKGTGTESICTSGGGIPIGDF